MKRFEHVKVGDVLYKPLSKSWRFEQYEEEFEGMDGSMPIRFAKVTHIIKDPLDGKTMVYIAEIDDNTSCLLYTSPSPRDS